MQKRGRDDTGQFTARHRRTGTLWESRCTSGLVDSDGYPLPCSRYIDLNPVRARMTDDPIGFPWSSCASLCGRRDDPLLSPRRRYARLGNSREERDAACRSLLADVLSDDDLQAIRTYLQQQRASGLDDFRERVDARTRPFAGIRPPPTWHRDLPKQVNLLTDARCSLMVNAKFAWHMACCHEGCRC